MAKGYLSNRQKNLKLGISSYTENSTVLEVTGKVGIGTTNATSNLYVVGDTQITGVTTLNKLDVNQLSPDGSDFGSYQYVPVANNSGGWSWQPVTSAGAGILNGIDILEDGVVVGTSGSISSLDFRSNIIATGIPGGSISTISVSDTPSFSEIEVTGISTLGNVKISSGIVTATSGIVTYYGDGSKLTGFPESSIQVLYNNINIGTGTTSLNFNGTGISSVTFNSGISTITVDIQSNLDGGSPNSNYGGIESIDGGRI
jgi:hypothetical protein